MKGIDCMQMYPLLAMAHHGKALLNNLFSISINNFRQLDELTPLTEQLPVELWVISVLEISHVFPQQWI